MHKRNGSHSNIRVNYKNWDTLCDNDIWVDSQYPALHLRCDYECSQVSVRYTWLALNNSSFIMKLKTDIP